MRQLVRGLPEEARRLLGVVVHAGLSEAKHERERDEPLLRPVVEVALEPATLDVARLDEARARASQLVLVELALGDVHAGDEEPRLAAVVPSGVVDHVTRLRSPADVIQVLSNSPRPPSAATSSSSRRTPSRSSGR